jgi:nickel-dependent lactate racemase
LVLVLVEIWLPYGRSEIPARVPDERLVDILKRENGDHLSDPVGEAAKLLESNESFLRKVRDSSRSCVVLGSCGTTQLATDLTRAVLQHLNNAQSSATILCTEESPELEAESVGASRVLRHSPKSEAKECNPVKGGFTPQVNSAFVNADIRILIGELRPQQFLGYAGLCDLIFPDLGSEASVRAHLSDRAGSSLRDIHAERVDVAKSFDNLFALGLALDAEARPTALNLGGMEDCLAALKPIVDDLYSKQVTKRCEILVMSAGGAPFDSTLTRAVESFPAGLTALKKDGALIVAAECGEGHGGGQFYEWASEHKEPRHLESRLRHRFSYEGFKASFLARVLQTHRIYLVSTIPDYYVEHVFDMRPSQTVNAALQTAQRAHGSDSTISVVPNALRVACKLPDAGAS